MNVDSWSISPPPTATDTSSDDHGYDGGNGGNGIGGENDIDEDDHFILGSSLADSNFAPAVLTPNTRSLLGHFQAREPATSVSQSSFGFPSLTSTITSPMFCPSTTNFLSSSSSEDGDEDDSISLFGTSVSHPRRAPKRIVGSKSSFILGDKLGEGAHATVREGIDERSLRIVAVKILDLQRLRRIRGGLDALDREVAVMKVLKRHRNLIELIDVIRQRPPKSKMYIILEMATGGTVQELLDSSPQKRLCELQVANLAFQALTGLQYMHGRGVVHRDIKPANLMLTSDGTLKISDFGVAERLNEYKASDNVTRTSGSPAFQAPEIARGEPDYSGMKVDVWALGVTIYFLLSGRIPFQGDTLVALFEHIGVGHFEPLSDVTDECKDVITRMLTVSWHDRASVESLLKHPWILRGSSEPSSQRMSDTGWVPVPKKEFGILDVVKRMYVSEDEGLGPPKLEPRSTGETPSGTAEPAQMNNEENRQSSRWSGHRCFLM